MRRYPHVNEEKRKILEYLKTNPHRTVKNIANSIFGDESRKSCLTASRRLHDLIDSGLVDRFMVDPIMGGGSEYSYHLTRAGSRQAGLERTPARHLKRPTKAMHEYSQAKLFLSELANSRGWRFTDIEEKCRDFMFYFYLYTQSIRNSTDVDFEAQKVKENKIYIFPEIKYSPDMLLLSEFDAIIVIISSPSSTGKFLNKRIDRYRDILSIAKILVITFNDRQYENCMSIARGSTYVSRILIVKYNDIKIIPQIIDISRLKYMQFKEGRAVIYVSWNKKEGNAPPEKFDLEYLADAYPDLINHPTS